MLKIYRSHFYECILLFMVLLNGCIQEVKDKNFINESASKLVVSSIISPEDTILRVYLKKTRPFFNDNNDPNLERVEDAQVILSDGNKSVSLIFNPDNPYFSAYEIDAKLLPIMEGKTYHLNISTPSGLQVTSQCTIPLPKEINILKLDSIETYNNGIYLYRHTYYLQLEIQNSTDEKVYFGMSTEYNDMGIYNGYTDTTYRIFNRYFNFNLLNGPYKFYAKCENRCVQKFEVNKLEKDDNNYFYKVTPLALNVVFVNENFYEYDLDYYNNRAIYNTDTSSVPKIEGYPYSEPSTHYTNIEGGYGIFAGYVRVRKFLGL